MTTNDTPALPVHPTTGLRALGMTSRGPIWPVLGGDETGSGSDGQGGTAGTGQQPAGGDSGQGQQPPAGQQSTDDLANLDPGALADMVRKLRKENAGDRTRAKQNAAQEAESALVQKLGKTLGLIKDDGDRLDPDQLTQQLQAAQQEAATLRVESAAGRAARAAGLDADALLDSREFAGKLRKLDPTADTFDSDLESLVKSYADNPRYKTSTGQAPARSGGDFSGGPGHAPTFTREQIARMTPTEYAKNRDAIMAQLNNR